MAFYFLVPFYLLFPALVIWLCRKFPLLNKIGEILILYFVGIVIGNLGILPKNIFTVQDTITSVVVPLAIPLMLFSCDFKKWSIKKTLINLVGGITAVMTTVIICFFIYKPYLNDNVLINGQLSDLSGMLVGVYTGGTPNLAALKVMLDVNPELYILTNSYDVLVCVLYLSFLLAGGFKIFRKFLPKYSTNGQNGVTVSDLGSGYHDIVTKKNLPKSLIAVLISLCIVGVSVGISYVITSSINMIVVILLLTTLGIAMSFVRYVRKIEKSFDVGMYLVLIFSFVVASMANLSKLDFVGGLYIFLYLGTVVFGSLIIQTILAKIFKIDADSMVISSVSLINSPSFVPLIATAMKNREVIITGLTVGLAGYAVGNYLGFIVAELLSNF